MTEESGSGMMDIGMDSKSGNTDDGVTVGATVGAIALIFVLVGCVAVVWCRKRRILVSNKSAEDGVSNIMYGTDEMFDQSQDVHNEGRPHEYTLPTEINSNVSSDLEKGYTYAYASMEGRKRGSSCNSNKHARDKIYMTPAREEKALYAQIVDIKIKELSRSSIEIGEALGSGNFATVRQGQLSSSIGTREVAVKILKEGSGKEDRVKFLQEATIMGQFKHPNVVKIHGIVVEDDPMLIVLELLTNGDLRNFLIDERYKPVLSIDEHTLLSYCRQVASGMVYLSNKAFVHRDLAARNILLSENSLCKIADFGLSRDLMDEDYYISRGGQIPVKWTAPEAVHYRKYSSASDVWSYGIVLFEIWSLGHKPYEDLSMTEAMDKVEEGYRMPPPPGCPRAIYQLMINTWHPTSTDRPSFTEIMQQLSLPDTLLLERTDEDNSSPATKLGAELSHGLNLHKDLQEHYLDS